MLGIGIRRREITNFASLELELELSIPRDKESNAQIGLASQRNHQ